MTYETERLVRNHLRAGASLLAPDPPGPDTARARAGRRRRHQRVGLAVVSCLAVAVAGLGLSTVLAGAGDDSVIADEGPVDGNPIAGPAAGADDGAGLDLSWRWVDGVVHYADDVVTTGDGTTYALSTAPGVRYEDIEDFGRPPAAIYHTTDGESWESTLLDDSRAWTDLAERDGVLYTIATAPGGDDETTTAEVGMSADGGEGWDWEPLPVAITEPEADVPLWGGANVQLAVTGDMTAALVTARYFPDPRSVIEQRFGSTDFIWDQTTDGLVVSGFDGCGEPATPDEPTITAAPTTAAPTTAAPTTAVDGTGAAVERVEITEVEAAQAGDRGLDAIDTLTECGLFSWEELGIDDPTDLTTRHLLLGDGGEWQEVQVPPLDGTETGERLYGTSSGLVLEADRFDPGAQATTTDLWHSPDGIDWSLVTSAPLGWGEAVWGDRVLSQREGGGLLVSIDGGVSFGEQDLSGLLPASDDEEVWINDAASGPLGFAVLAEVSQRGSPEVFLAEDPAVDPPASDQDVATEPPGEPSYYLLTSTDGVSWSVTDLAAEGLDAWPSQVLVGADHVAVVETADEKDGNGDLRHHVLLGTPQR